MSEMRVFELMSVLIAFGDFDVNPTDIAEVSIFVDLGNN